MENGTTKKVKQSHIDDLRHILSGTKARVITAEDEAYSTSISRWSTAAVKPAGVVAIPTTVHEVSLVVKYATEQALDLAIKGGGHSTAGASSTDGGLLLDLHASMRNVTVDSERKLLRVQGGANWGDVDRAAAQYGLATVGGTVADTGVGGLTLGGGYGWLSGQYGLVVDNLVSCTIVVASGEIVTASADENADLFWAVCGAGQNFGVVVEFVFRAFEQGDVWGGMLMFSPKEDVMHRVVEAVNELYTPDQEGRTKIAGRAGGGLGIARPPPAGGEVMLMMMPYPQANQILAVPYGALRISMKGAAFHMPIKPAFVQDILRSYDSFTSANSDRAGSVILFEVYDPHQVIRNSSGSFANRGTHFNGMIAPMWTDSQNDAESRQWARDVNEMFKAELASRGAETGRGSKVAWA
ncbi:hypothetical protein H2203_009088 [Taxawa tesnikishii (nom. ined.)]|nr:hypothetical protein H2203_009088 [Dothideales sp. JES 119]